MKTSRVELRLTPSMKQEWLDAASAADLTLTEWMISKIKPTFTGLAILDENNEVLYQDVGECSLGLFEIVNFRDHDGKGRIVKWAQSDGPMVFEEIK